MLTLVAASVYALGAGAHGRVGMSVVSCVGERSQQPVASVIAITAFWRDRYGEVEDPFGFGWAIATQHGGPERSKN